MNNAWKGAAATRWTAAGQRRCAWVLGLCGLSTGCDLPDLTGFDRAHTVVLVVERAPGPFKHVTWHADYQGTHCPSGKHTVVLKVMRINEQRYEVTVPPRPADTTEGPDQDNRCRWQLVSTSARLAATNAEGDEVFEARLTAEQLDRGRPLVLYYWRGTYPRMPGAIITRSLGEPDRQVFRPEFQNQLFTITLTPRAAQ